MNRWLLLKFWILVWASVAAAKSIVEILETDDKYKVFVRQLKKADLLEELGAYREATVFAPANEAFNQAAEHMTRGQLLYHIVPKTIKTKDFYEGELLKTSYTEDGRHQKIKLTSDDNKWSPGKGISIVESDVGAENGVIQVINGLLTPPKDLEQTLSEHDPLHEFHELAQKAHIATELKRATGYTIFATQDVLDGLTEHEKAYLNHSAARTDLAEVLHHQIAGKELYFSEFPTGKTQLETLQGEPLEIVVDKNSKATINGAKIIKTDILASNGVIHLVEKSILPKDRDFLKMDVRKTLIGLNATKFVQLLETHGLEDYLKTSDAHTIIAPPNEELDESQVPRNMIESWLKYHIVNKKYDLDNFTDGELLRTESNDHLGGNNKQRLPVHVIEQTQKPANAMRKSVQFDRASLIGNPVAVDNSIIYPVSRSLTLPRDPLSRLPLNLDLSTFVASLYASGAADEIQHAEGITLFAPTNKAFARLGILTKHLLQPSSQDKLANVIKFHATKHDLFYLNETTKGEHRAATLAGTELNVNKTDDGNLYIRGTGAGDGSDRSVIGKVVRSDMLVSTGVIHKVDRVEIPVSLKVTNRDLLLAESTNSFATLLSKTNISDQVLDRLDQPYTILAPSDRAFSKLNVTELLHDPEQLLRIARLHVLPVAIPRMSMEPDQGGRVNSYFDDEGHDSDNTHSDIDDNGVEFEPLLSDERIVITKVDAGYTVHIKGDSGNSADVINLGRATNNGGVIEIDRVLLPSDISGGGGLPWWAVLLIVIGVLLGAAVLAAVGYFGWRWWKSRREGYISLDDNRD